jgi:hypothetical protein
MSPALRASLTAAAIATVCLAGSASAAVVVNSFSDVAPTGGTAGTSYTPTTLPIGASSTDLIQGMTATVTYSGPGGTGSTTNESSAGVSAWTNGSLTTVYATTGQDALNHAAYGTVGAQTGNAARLVNVTYDLGALYNLSSINVFSGWNDSGRDDSSFNVMVSTDNSTFTTIATYTKGPDDTSTGPKTPITNLHNVVDSGGATIAPGVRYVTIQFTDADNGFAGVSEIDVLGTAVPEAGTTLLGLLGGLLLLRRKRN